MPEADAAPAREPLPALPTDVWQIIARFAEPVSAAATRHLAAPARTLHEHVQHKLDGNKDEWHDRTHAQDDVDRTQHCLKLLNTLRTVSTEWRDIVNYRSTCEIALKSDACLNDERNRRDAILRPLSLAIPDLRFHLHSDENDDFPKDASMHWWHALCGYDWWDPVFGSPDPP